MNELVKMAILQWLIEHCRIDVELVEEGLKLTLTIEEEIVTHTSTTVIKFSALSQLVSGMLQGASVG